MQLQTDPKMEAAGEIGIKKQVQRLLPVQHQMMVTMAAAGTIVGVRTRLQQRLRALAPATGIEAVEAVGTTIGVQKHLQPLLHRALAATEIEVAEVKIHGEAGKETSRLAAKEKKRIGHLGTIGMPTIAAAAGLLLPLLPPAEEEVATPHNAVEVAGVEVEVGADKVDMEVAVAVAVAVATAVAVAVATEVVAVAGGVTGIMAVMVVLQEAVAGRPTFNLSNTRNQEPPVAEPGTGTTPSRSSSSTNHKEVEVEGQLEVEVLGTGTRS